MILTLHLFTYPVEYEEVGNSLLLFFRCFIVVIPETAKLDDVLS